MISEKFNKEFGNLEYNKDKRDEYHKRGKEINHKFKLALFKEYGVETNIKREKCWELAWERGHSGGYSEVELEFIDLAELIK